MNADMTAARGRPPAGVRWLRRNLFRSPVDAAVTVVAGCVAAWLLCRRRSLRVRHRTVGDRAR